MRRLFSAVVLVGAGLSLGCQSYTEGMQVLCDAPNEADLAQVAPDQRFRVMADYLDDAVSNERVETLFEALAVKAPADKLAAVEAAQKEAGVTQCGFADELREFVKLETKARSGGRP